MLLVKNIYILINKLINIINNFYVKKFDDEHNLPHVDAKNSNTALKNKPPTGTIILRDFVFDAMNGTAPEFITRKQIVKTTNIFTV